MRLRAALAVPSTRLRAVVIGTRTMSSWSGPIGLWPLASSTPITANGTRLMRIVWPTGSAVAEQLLRHRRRRASRPWRAPAISRRLEAAPGGDRPVAHVEVLGRDADHLRRPVGVAGDHLRRAAQRRRRAAPRASRGRSPRVVLGQRRARADAQAHAARRWSTPGSTISRLEPSARICSSHARLRARADRDHRDHRADADDDAEHGERAAQLVDAPARAARRASSAPKFMQRPAGSVRRAASLRPPCRRGTRCTRRAKRATSGSWVTSTTVMPWRLSSWNSAMISRLVLRVERAGRLVGEDQRGSLTSARAIATRCCWPPESCVGLVVARARPGRRASSGSCARLRSLARRRRRRPAAARRSRARGVRGSRLNSGTRSRCCGCGARRARRRPAARHVLAVEQVLAARRPVEAAEDVHAASTCPSPTGPSPRRTRPASMSRLTPSSACTSRRPAVDLGQVARLDEHQAMRPRGSAPPAARRRSAAPAVPMITPRSP